MNARLRNLLVILLVTAGALQLAFVGIVTLGSSMLERSSRGSRIPAGWTESASATRKAARPGRRIAHLEIERLDLRAAVVEGVDAKSLLTGVGHVPNTAFPGEPENVSLAGHRDTHFKPLRKIKPGDRIEIDTPDGMFVYVVDTAFVVQPDRGDLMEPTGRATLTLITCYPFSWIGTAPERFVVRAHGLPLPSPGEDHRAANSSGSERSRAVWTTSVVPRTASSTTTPRRSSRGTSS